MKQFQCLCKWGHSGGQKRTIQDCIQSFLLWPSQCDIHILCSVTTHNNLSGYHTERLSYRQQSVVGLNPTQGSSSLFKELWWVYLICLLCLCLSTSQFSHTYHVLLEWVKSVQYVLLPMEEYKRVVVDDAMSPLLVRMSKW